MLKDLLIPQEDYNRIFNTIYSLLLSEDADIHHSCIPFSVVGSVILDKHYNIKAKVYMGMAAYMIDGINKNVLAFAEKVDGRHICSKNAFHSWIESDDFVIDFTAPLFTNMVSDNTEQCLCTPMMFQKMKTSMVNSPSQLEETGDFFLNCNDELTNELMDTFVEDPYNIDLVNVCCSWYKKPPLEMLKIIPISDGLGSIKNTQLQPLRVCGSW